MKTKTKNRDCPLIRGLDDRMVKPFNERLRTEAQEFCLNNCPLPKCFDELYHQKKKLTHAERGRLGGYVTFSRYGHEGMSEWGKKGGRSRLPTLAVIRQQQLLIAQYKKEGKDTPGKLPNNLKELRKLLRHGSNGHKQIQEGARGDLIASGSGRS